MFDFFARRGATLLAIVLVLSVTACAGNDKASAIDVEQEAFDDLRAAIRETIDDPFREMEALTLTNELIEALEHLRGRVTERRQRVIALYANYDTTREEFDAFFDEIETEIQVHRMEVIESERALLRVLTDEEEKSLEKAQTKAMKAATRSIQSI